MSNQGIGNTEEGDERETRWQMTLVMFNQQGTWKTEEISHHPT
jgi:hypothetical protein